MPKKTTRRRQAPTHPVANFLRRPVIQLGLVATVILVVVLIALTGNGPTSSAANEISVQEAYKLYQQGNAFFLDVRVQSEWDEYHAPNTTLIPLEELAARLKEVPKDRQVVVICRSGNRSQQGREILTQAGFANVVSMAGGLKDWKTKGYPVEP